MSKISELYGFKESEYDTPLSKLDIPAFRRVRRRVGRKLALTSLDVPPWRRVRRRISRKLALTDISGLPESEIDSLNNDFVDMYEGTGILSIDSNEEVQVLVDGKPYGISPLAIVNLEIGIHKLEILNPRGYQYRKPYVMDVNILDDHIDSVTIDY